MKCGYSKVCQIDIYSLLRDIYIQNWSELINLKFKVFHSTNTNTNFHVDFKITR